MNANKTRTALTVLGMLIGIATIIVVFSAGQGIKALLMDQLEAFGVEVVETEVKLPSNKSGAAADTQSAVSMATGVQITTLTLDDMEDLRHLPNVKNAYAGIMSQELVAYQNESAKADIFGTTASYVEIDQSRVQQGRWFTEAEDRSLAQVTVLGKKMADKLFNQIDPVGRFIKIRKEKFLVIGVMKERGSVMYIDFDNYVYLPIRTLQKKLMGINHVLYLVHQLADVSLADQTVEEMRQTLRQNHDINADDPTDFSKDDFRIVTMEESIALLNQMMQTVTWLLLAIVAVSLIVGGVGIMNIMYVIVAERAAEIGLRKAVGATYRDIMWEFLIEAVLITLFGGVIGVILGSLLSWLVALVASASFNLDWHLVIPLEALVVAFVFSISAGLLFGVYPARKAARLDPIEALRHE